MPYCSVKFCGKSSKTSSIAKDGITFHRFPNCPKLKEKWIDATKRDDNWFPGKNHVICSRHFTGDCFRIVGRTRRFLFDTAVPTQMLPCLANYQTPLESSTSSKPVIADNNIMIMTPTESSSSIDAICISVMGSVQDNFAMPSTTTESEIVGRVTFTPEPQQNTNVDSLLSIPSNYSTLRERHLYRKVIDLSQKVKKKNIIVKRLRDSNRILKRKVNSLKQLLGDLEKHRQHRAKQPKSAKP